VVGFFPLGQKKLPRSVCNFANYKANNGRITNICAKKAEGGKFKNCNYVHTVYSTVYADPGHRSGIGGLVVIFEPIREQNTLRTF
jgi:hypothetical protein